MYIIFWPGGLLTFYDPFLIKVGQPENLFSLKVFFLYFSNQCHPQKVLNKVTCYGAKVQWVTTKKELINSKVLCCYYQGYYLFFYILTILTNALPGTQWVRDKETWQQTLAQQ